jgi:hypothetical protein
MQMFFSLPHIVSSQRDQHRMAFNTYAEGLKIASVRFIVAQHRVPR